MENHKIFVNRTIENNPFYMAPVEIIIPFHGEQARVTKLIESIFKTVHTNRYLISLVDDASENDKWIKEIDRAKLPGVRCFRSEKQLGFGASVNLALRTPFSETITWVAIVQSDVFMDDSHWLSNLGETLNRLKKSGVKMVSPKTNNSIAGFNVLHGKKGDLRDDVILEDEFLPMYCVLSHRELFKRVGFLAEYPFAGTEAEDYAKRMKNMGFKQAVCGKSWVHHDGRATLSRYDKDGKVQEILRNVQEEYYRNNNKGVIPE